MDKVINITISQPISCTGNIHISAQKPSNQVQDYQYKCRATNQSGTRLSISVPSSQPIRYKIINISVGQPANQVQDCRCQATSQSGTRLSMSMSGSQPIRGIIFNIGSLHVEARDHSIRQNIISIIVYGKLLSLVKFVVWFNIIYIIVSNIWGYNIY